MVSKLLIRNFKCLRDIQIALERFTVFVGPNASGKSSILQGLDLLCLAFRQAGGMAVLGGVGFGGIPVRDVERELSQAVSRGSKDSVELAAEAGGAWHRYRTHAPSSQPPAQHIAQAKWEGYGPAVAPDLASNAWKQWQPEQSRSAPLPLSVLLRLEASKLVEAAPAAPDPSVMAPDGTGLHSALASMALHDPDSWHALQANLRRVIPTIRRLRHTKSGNMQQPTALLFDTAGAESLPASQVSEGTLLVLGLLAALHAAGRPSLVLLDDLDRGLHPKAQKELIALLRVLLEANRDLQIVAATHSPYMLDSMEPNEVRMTQLNDEGSTVCAALTRHPKFQKWKDEFHSGEMWSLFGEKWLVEQEATTS